MLRGGLPRRTLPRVKIVHTIPELTGLLGPKPQCALVPTMGALHAGHASLVGEASSQAKRRGFPGGCVVSVFVNPTQFNDKDDLARYPRTLEADAELCKKHGATYLFAPTVEDIYPPGRGSTAPAVPDAASKPHLEDRLRPGHFAGVCQVVLRFFQIIRPRVAFFGEKDWQQFQVIRALARQHSLAVEVVSSPTVRESDGLAMSSRNQFLGKDDRKRATALIRGLRAAGRAPSPAAAENAIMAELAKEGIIPDYAVVRDAETLCAPQPGKSMRALVAARVGTVRLLDNLPYPNGI